jgi:hypothetical protein
MIAEATSDHGSAESIAVVRFYPGGGKRDFSVSST